MNRVLLLAVSALAACATSRPILPAPPAQGKDASSVELSAIDLDNEVNLPGYRLRARAVRIEPGGYTAAHFHRGRPTQEYVAQGTVIEVRNGQAIEHHAGEIVQGPNGLHHWWENHGAKPVVLIPVDIDRR